MGGLSGLLETTGQQAQAGIGLTFQALLLATIVSQCQSHLRKEVRGEGENTGFALGAEREGGRGVGLAASAMAGGFAAAASQGDQGAAQKDGAGGRIG